ncbi:class I SAM-dependent methyltransferase [Paenibacillus athensensis]|uniref:Methyltransferase type 11 domain-containing protein n=1 Tax=Paenibacillus athensensis TaxID=1967502 RepID=A0A4Y8PR54_9BACL|nr:class I SAM-dependent methyltransferase [Paenibacillus athensensis]MCD1258799.1 class I SAM-dependent methyltransferase [Paenibacillus athensensis]
MTELLESRFFVETDERLEKLIYPLPASWWSRPYEYGWCCSLVQPEDVALDAACGVPHPFKWMLGRVCRQAHACDWDSRVLSPEAMLEEVARDIGYEAARTVAAERFIETICAQADITRLPYKDEMFDKIFCISVLEHLHPADAGRALEEFHRTLKPGGLLLLTLDYPTVNLEAFDAAVRQSGLRFSGPVDYERPENAVHTELWGGLSCFRAALSKPQLGSELGPMSG